MFPNQFDFLTNSDFQMSSGHIYPDDETVRHDLISQRPLMESDCTGMLDLLERI